MKYLLRFLFYLCLIFFSFTIQFLHAEDDVASYANQVENLCAMNVLGIDDTTIQIESQSGPNFGGYNSYHTNLEVISEHSSVANSKWHMSSFWNYLFDLLN